MRRVDGANGLIGAVEEFPLRHAGGLEIPAGLVEQIVRRDGGLILVVRGDLLPQEDRLILIRRLLPQVRAIHLAGIILIVLRAARGV